MTVSEDTGGDMSHEMSHTTWPPDISPIRKPPSSGFCYIKLYWSRLDYTLYSTILD